MKDFLASSITVCIDDTALLDPNMQELGVNPPQLLLACLPNLGQVQAHLVQLHSFFKLLVVTVL